MPRKIKETGLFNMGFGSPVLPRRQRTRISPPPPPPPKEITPSKRKTLTWENIPGERRKPHTQGELETLERLTQEEIGDAIRESSRPFPKRKRELKRGKGLIAPEKREPIPRRRIIQ